MKEFIINEQQINQIAAILFELPAKTVLSTIDLLRNLPDFKEKKENKE